MCSSDVEMHVEWQQIEVRELKKGDIIPLDRKRLNQVEVQLAGETKFIGHLGNLNDKVAVQLKERFRP